MVHGYAVTNADGIKLKRHATFTTNSNFYSLGNTAQMDMAGHNLIETIDHTNKRFRKIIAANANSPKQSTMWCPLNAFLYAITTHRLQNRLLY
jgi:hypothetical protein